MHLIVGITVSLDMRRFVQPDGQLRDRFGVQYFVIVL
jgi:hypothetical protein